MTRKVLIFSLAYYPSHVSGAEAAIKEITERIQPADIEFHLITLLFDPHAPRQERMGNVRVHRVGVGGTRLSKIFFIPLAALEARRLHAIHHFDALWAMMTYMLFPVVLAKLIGVRTPHILTLQDGDPYEKVFERWFIKPLTPVLDWGFRHATVIQVISAYLASWPKRRGYVGHIVHISNGANPRDLKNDVDPNIVEDVRRRIGKKEGEVWLVNTARLVHQKANDITIRALTLLPAHVKLLLVGGGEDEAMLKELADTLKLSDRVMFTGPVERTEVTAYRLASDIYVGPSRSEGLGNAWLSAMASRLPVIATQEGGLAEFIYDEKHNPDLPQTAWVVEKESPEDIAHAVKEILAHPEKVQVVTQNARNLVVSKYDWDMVGKEMREKVFAPIVGDAS